MTAAEARLRLQALAEPAYRAFNGALLPGEGRLFGVRMAPLRALAKEIARGDWRAYLDGAIDEWHEEALLSGLVLGYAAGDWETARPYAAAHMKKLRNWAMVDVFCGDLKMARDARAEVWAFIGPYFLSDAPYERRFAVVMSLLYFLDDAYIDAVLAWMDRTANDHYYVRMAVAWAVSMAYVARPERTERYLLSGSLGDWTHNKAIAKIIESRQVDAQTKNRLRGLRRGGRRKA